MTIATARTVRSGDAELLPIPADMAFGEGVELRLARSGDVLTVQPVEPAQRPTLEEMFAKLRALPGPVSVEVRDVELLPEPRGL